MPCEREIDWLGLDLYFVYLSVEYRGSLCTILLIYIEFAIFGKIPSFIHYFFSWNKLNPFLTNNSSVFNFQPDERWTSSANICKIWIYFYLAHIYFWNLLPEIKYLEIDSVANSSATLPIGSNCLEGRLQRISSSQLLLFCGKPV